MANKMRWRYGDTNPVSIAPGEVSLIEIGDLVFLSNGQADAASSLDDQGSITGNQEAFHDQFVGVAMEASLSDSTKPIRIATSGVFEFEIAPATVQVGDLLGAQEDDLGTGLLDQVLVGVATPNLAVGRCSQTTPAGATKVLVEIVSTTMQGGPQAAA